MIFPAQQPKMANAILLTVANQCLCYDIPYYLAYGTCLGLYRDGTHIPYHNDIDFAMVYSDENFENLAKSLASIGFEGVIGTEEEGRHFWKFGILVDLHWVHQKSYYKQHGLLRYDDYDYHVPHPVEKYLKWLYGPTWRTPQEGFQQLQLGKDLQVKYG